MFSLVKQSAFNRHAHCFRDSFSGSLRFLSPSSISYILEAVIPSVEPAGRGMCRDLPLGLCEFQKGTILSNKLASPKLPWQFFESGTLEECQIKFSMLPSPGEPMHTPSLRGPCSFRAATHCPSNGIVHHCIHILIYPTNYKAGNLWR